MNQAAARTLWREFVTEKDTTRVADSTIDLYLQRGLEALNRIVGYAWKDDTSVSTASGTQEYTLPTDCVEILYVLYGTTLIPKTDLDDLRRDGIDWRGTTAAPPTFYYVFGRKLGFYPKPNATTTVTLRYIAAPLDFTASGFDQLADQDQALPIYYAASLWGETHPGAAMQAPAAALMQRFLQEATVLKQQYDARKLVRAGADRRKELTG